MSEKISTALALNQKSVEVSQKIDAIVNYAIAEIPKKNGFEKALLQATAINQISELIDENYMNQIMPLAGSRLGFKTDKPAKDYKPEVIKSCVIEAILTGVQIVGNQFNILMGTFYPTKEGFKFLIDNKVAGLSYKVKNGIPKVENGYALIIQRLSWKVGDEEFKTDVVEFSIKVNNGMSHDAIIGKAERKSYAYIYNQATGSNLSDGDVEDIRQIYHVSGENKTTTLKNNPKSESQNSSKIEDAEIINESENKEEMIQSEEEIRELTDNQKRAIAHIEKATSIEDLEARWKVVLGTDVRISEKYYEDMKSKLTSK